MHNESIPMSKCYCERRDLAVGKLSHNNIKQCKISVLNERQYVVLLNKHSIALLENVMLINVSIIDKALLKIE